MESDLAAGRQRLNRVEEQLLDRLRAGDREAFQTLLRPHLGSLVALARRLTGDTHWADDLTQETLVRAFHGLPRFRGEASLRTWLLRILVHVAAEPSRWKRSEPAQALPEAGVPDRWSEPPDDAALRRELQDRMREAVERLPPRQRLAIHLRAIEGMDYAAIAAVIGCSNGAARMLVLGARERIQQRIGGYLSP
jgi:RNA polymerase sigma-70 factor (ECF subfamily)